MRRSRFVDAALPAALVVVAVLALVHVAIERRLRSGGSQVRAPSVTP